MSDRKAVDEAVRRLWSAFRVMSDRDPRAMTDADAHLWSQAAMHPAVQSRLEAITTPYGRCPFCGAPCRFRERRVGGNDHCEGGHVYPSASAVDEGH